MLVIMILYAALKFEKLMMRSNPDVSSFFERGVVSTRQKLNLSDAGMQFAFGVEGYLDKQPKDDPRFVKGILRLNGYRDGIGYERLLPYHKCTDEDWQVFAPPAEEAESLFRSYKEDPDRNLFCIDWDKFEEELAIWGVQEDTESF